MFVTQDRVLEPLHVVTAIFNPARYKSRWKHYARFARHVQDSGAILHTVEATFGAREAAIDHVAPTHSTPPTPYDPMQSATHTYHQVQVSTEVWLKENLLNYGIARLPADWKYVAWVDADLLFTRPNWVGETIHQLQHYDVVQLWSECQDVSPRYEVLARHRSFMACYLDGTPQPPQGFKGGHYGHKTLGVAGPFLWHPGFAWAARRSAIDQLGGLLDFAVLGAADNHMAYGLVGRAAESVHPQASAGYRADVLEWGHRAERHLRRNVGYVSGLVTHFWHGKKANRRYWDRWRILVEHGFTPRLDLKYDRQGILQLVDRGGDRSRLLRDRLREYFRARDEDSIDT